MLKGRPKERVCRLERRIDTSFLALVFWIEGLAFGCIVLVGPLTRARGGLTISSGLKDVLFESILITTHSFCR